MDPALCFSCMVSLSSLPLREEFTLPYEQIGTWRITASRTETRASNEMKRGTPAAGPSPHKVNLRLKSDLVIAFLAPVFPVHPKVKKPPAPRLKPPRPMRLKGQSRDPQSVALKSKTPMTDAEAHFDVEAESQGVCISSCGSNSVSLVKEEVHLGEEDEVWELMHASQVFDLWESRFGKFYFSDPQLMKNNDIIVRIGGAYFPWDVSRIYYIKDALTRP
ncbi:hypothetical protein IFM89_012032 [Coptis chinensis]|uniref:Uncharacterized protein n=1 Tax=Coptis chinensis TaxID=261450 RepID=A0A835M9T5_9MAGN|nr:hypothetical protein IFM89_012032 [Coptis chinensis]